MHTLDKAQLWLYLVAGDRFKVLQRLVATSKGNFASDREKQPKAVRMAWCPMPEATSRKVMGSNPGAGNIFTAKSPLKNTHCTLCWKLYIAFVREAQRINLSRVYMWQINLESEKVLVKGLRLLKWSRPKLDVLNLHMSS